MANIKLAGAVRHKGVRYVPGQEKELVEILSKDEIQAFKEKELLVEVQSEGVEIESNNEEIEVLIDELKAANERGETAEKKVADLEAENSRLIDELKAAKAKAKTPAQ